MDTCLEGEERGGGLLQGKLAGGLRGGVRPLCETKLEAAPGQDDTCLGGEAEGGGYFRRRCMHGHMLWRRGGGEVP